MGIMSSARDKGTNPLIPATYSYSVTIFSNHFDIIKQEVSKLVKATVVKNGALDIEMVITKEDKLYFLDVGFRIGGNMLPEYISIVSNNDLVEATIMAAMGDADKIANIELKGVDGGCLGLYVIHADKEGILKRVEYVEGTDNYLKRQHLFKPIGSQARHLRIPEMQLA